MLKYGVIKEAPMNLKSLKNAVCVKVLKAVSVLVTFGYALGFR